MRRWVTESFPAIQAAWSSGSIGALEPFVSSALGDQLARELAGLRRDGVVNRVEDARLQDVRPLFDTEIGPVVEVVFTARDWLADLRTGRPVDGDPNRIASFRQHWRLLHEGAGRWLLDEVQPA